MDLLTDIIIPVCAQTRACYLVASTAIRTCVEHSAGANVFIAANNMPIPQYKQELRELCEALGAKWSWYGDGLMNISHCFNVHIDSTSSPYYGVFGQDTIFYQNWLVNLHDAWQREPDYFCLQPFTFNTWRHDMNRLRVKHQYRGIIEMRQPCGPGIVFRRGGGFRFDEKCPTECDSDLYWYLKHHRLREGVVLNSRVDHLGQVVMSELGGDWSNATPHENSTEYLRKKWNVKI